MKAKIQVWVPSKQKWVDSVRKYKSSFEILNRLSELEKAGIKARLRFI